MFLSTATVSRRNLLRAGGAGVALAASLGNLASTASPPTAWAATSRESDRQRDAFELRRDAAAAYLRQRLSDEANNGDEDRYADKRASFAKTLAHNDLGEPDPANFDQFVATLTRGESDAFAQLPRAPGAQVKLNNPRAAYAFELAGLDGHATRVAPPPAFASAEQARDLIEVYWQALALDIPFVEYDTDPLIAAAIAELNGLSAPSATVDPTTVFRGPALSDAIGPYLSQLLWQSIPYGIHTIDQSYRFPTRGQWFLTDYASWIASQRGAKATASIQFDASSRYISSYRELAEYVHQDFSFGPYLSAALIMLRFGDDALSPTNPYHSATNDFGDITFGNKNVLTLVAQAALLGQKGSWYHKWLVHRRARPEVIGGRIENHLSGNAMYDLHPDLLQSDAVARARQLNGTALLPLAYPEGSPTHPSFPSAHAANAGACATMLKAFFNEDFVVPDPVQASADGSKLEPWTGDPLTLGAEIDKLASNIAFGRDAAGVHFRTDSIQGLLVGESQAIGLLCDISRTYNERFDGFVFHTFDGRAVNIAGGRVA
jgi:membrane-associated phospholipid phosphatase